LLQILLFFIIVITSPSHCLLVSHGSRDPRYALAQQELLTAVQRLLPQSLLFAGVLELNDRPLHEQIITIVKTHHCPSLTVLPLFLQPGKHVLVDLPEELEKAQIHCQHQPLSCQVRPLPYLGAHPALHNRLQSVCTAPHTWILAAHGSNQPQTQTFFNQLHQTLGTQPAYWHHSPSLEDTVATLVEQGITHLGLLPYFLFPGKITDAITQRFQTLKNQYKHIDFNDRFLLLGQQPDFVRLIAHLLCTITEI
jgi:sirohydrochlorin ferrochelatase